MKFHTDCPAHLRSDRNHCLLTTEAINGVFPKANELGNPHDVSCLDPACKCHFLPYMYCDLHLRLQQAVLQQC